MDNSKEKSIKLSNKIYPIFYGLSSDLIFFIEVNTLFLTTVKGLTTSEINFMTTIGVLVALVFYLLSHKFYFFEETVTLFSFKLNVTSVVLEIISST